MSEFYRLRRTKITDAFALTGFILGFILPAYKAGERLAEGLEFGQAVEGFWHFMSRTLGFGIVGGVSGLGVGLVVGWVWERVHRRQRARRSGAGRAGAGRPSERSPHLAVPSPAETAVPPPEAQASVADPSIRVDRSGFTAGDYLALAREAMPGNYDEERTAAALERTVNIGAWDGETLVGAVRVLSDGYLLSTIPEIMVHPDYRRRGIGRALMQQAADSAPTGVLLFGAPPESAGFFERLGCQRAPAGYLLRRRMATAVKMK